MSFIQKADGEKVRNVEFTQEEIQTYRMLNRKVCDCYDTCDRCVLKTGTKCLRLALSIFLEEHEKPKTNADKFRETFGFPVFELHHLSAEEEGIWLEKEYKEQGVKDE